MVQRRKGSSLTSSGHRVRRDGHGEDRDVDNTQVFGAIDPTSGQLPPHIPRQLYSLKLVIHDTTERARQHRRAAQPVRGTIGSRPVPLGPVVVRRVFRKVDVRVADDLLEWRRREHGARLLGDGDRHGEVEVVGEQARGNGGLGEWLSALVRRAMTEVCNEDARHCC